MQTPSLFYTPSGILNASVIARNCSAVFFERKRTGSEDKVKTMSTESRSHRKTSLGGLVCCLATVALVAPSGQAQQSDQLEQQLQQLKQQYETSTRDLEQRILTLERQIEKQKEASAQEKEAA